MKKEKWVLDPDRFFEPEPGVRKTARQLYESVKDMPILSPHGHIDPGLFSDGEVRLPDPTQMIIIPDHYLHRMLYSQGIPLESLGIPRADGEKVEKDHKKIWRIFAENFHLYRGTPTGIWVTHELVEVFGIKYKLNADTADGIYDELCEKLQSEEYSPRKLFEKFNIEILATTDQSSDRLEHHRRIRESGWEGRVIPTFRPDDVTRLHLNKWKKNIEKLSEVSEIRIDGYKPFIEALRKQREYFKSMGATAADFGAATPRTLDLGEKEAEEIFKRALDGGLKPGDSDDFTAHMVVKMAEMSLEDGLVMQFHPGCYRNHNEELLKKFGGDKGADIPIQTEFVENLKPLLDRFGNDRRLTVVLFTMDETSYSREMAPLAGHYPALKLGPPWWFHDSINGMRRFRDQAMETAGLYNTTGFVDDTRALPSIPARHDVSRRMDANWLAGLVARSMVDMPAALEMMKDCTYRLSKDTFKL